MGRMKERRNSMRIKQKSKRNIPVQDFGHDDHFEMFNRAMGDMDDGNDFSFQPVAAPLLVAQNPLGKVSYI